MDLLDNVESYPSVNTAMSLIDRRGEEIVSIPRIRLCFFDGKDGMRNYYSIPSLIHSTGKKKVHREALKYSESGRRGQAVSASIKSRQGEETETERGSRA
jgi:hypothetical protein